jgi:hypothetical protein
MGDLKGSNVPLLVMAWLKRKPEMNAAKFCLQSFSRYPTLPSSSPPLSQTAPLIGLKCQNSTRNHSEVGVTGADEEGEEAEANKATEDGPWDITIDTAMSERHDVRR